MPNTLDSAALRQRQDTYLSSHYLSLHVTVVSLALGVAGVVLGSLVGDAPSAKFDGYQPVLYLLWLTSLLVIAVAYGGPMIGAILLPARIPAVVDFFLPMLLALCEFMLFTILGYRITGWTTPRAVLIGWWFSLAAFSFVALLQVWRAHYLISKAYGGAAASGIVIDQLRRLRSNMAGAGFGTLLGAFSGSYYLIFTKPAIAVSYVLATVAFIFHSLALVAHRETSKSLRSALEQPADESTTNPAEARSAPRLPRGADSAQLETQ